MSQKTEYQMSDACHRKVVARSLMYTIDHWLSKTDECHRRLVVRSQMNV